MGRRVDGGKLVVIFPYLYIQYYGTALGLAFLTSNYVIERHREVLLWSFLIARSDRDSCGTYSTRKRIAILQELGFTYSESNTGLGRGMMCEGGALLQRFSYVLGQWPSDPFLLFFFLLRSLTLCRFRRLPSRNGWYT
jgi:hypothetical protein